jgi:BTB/POZ domain-containing protein 13 (germ cell-less protein-like 1)
VKRQFLIRTTLASLNELRQVKHQQTTGIKSICLDRNEECLLLVMDKELTYPLQISVNLLVVTPNKPQSEAVGSQGSKSAAKPSTPQFDNDDDDETDAEQTPRSNSSLNCASSSCADGGIQQ